MGFGGNPYGPAGTGKTESVKALGQAFGRQVSFSQSLDVGRCAHDLLVVVNASQLYWAGEQSPQDFKQCKQKRLDILHPSLR